ncbi:G-protein coupled receptor [Biomphalaria pfeifferi]|uniref:G-protein coupled receptor n=1 Tax=Biomphalaria pfeifferi TaxID=112525 RepID=A0AAD8C3S3_BIOPF|nr:G-protein coupled receptor [Biomphalaria pfeifferi]
MNVTIAKDNQQGTSLISQNLYYWGMGVLHVAIVAFNVLGIVTNAINTVVFVKQGVTSDSISVSLFAMSVSDFLSSVLMFPQLVCYYLDTFDLTSVKGCYIVTSVVTSYPHIMCTKFTCLVQTYISLERAVCVVLPLHVKRAFNVKNTVIVNVVCCIVIFIIFTPYTFTVQFASEREKSNSTHIVLILTSLGQTLGHINYIISSFIINNTSICVISVATVVTLTRLNVTRKWRESVFHSQRNTDDTKARRLSAKSLELTKTVTVITTLYLICLLCSQLPAMTVFSLPGMSETGENKYLYQIVYTLRFDMEAMHSSLNLFFYLKLSSKYREVFYSIFRMN